MKKGFTLMELLAVIVILAIIAIITVPIILNIINETRIEKYKSEENAMEKAAQFYLIEEQNLLASEINDQEIDLNTLIGTKKIEKVYDSGNGKTCNGKVIVTRKENKISYKGCLQCSNYTTKGCGYGDYEEPEEPEEPELPDEPVVVIPEGYTPIYTEEDLIAMSSDVTAKYILMNNITLTQDWTPVGTSEAPFIGTLDGQGYKISGLKITSGSYKGLFGYVGRGAVIKNLEIENANITGSSNLGILSGQAIAFQEISNIVITGGTVSGTENIGGLIGYVKGGTTASKINNVGVTGVNVTGSSSYVGGLIGEIDYGAKTLIEKVYTTGEVKGKSFVGGLIGYKVNGNAADTQIKNSYSAANVRSTATGSNRAYAGGLIGYTFNLTLENTYAIGKVTYSSTYSTPEAGGLIGYASGVSTTNSYWTREASGVQVSAAGEVKLISELAQKDEYLNWDFEKTWAIEEGTTLAYLRNLKIPDEVYKSTSDYVTYSGGTGTEEDPYIITTEAQLRDMVNKAEAHFKLGNNITLTQDWTPVGTSAAPFKGTLDGQGYKISGLKITSGSYRGLFGYVENGAVIKNLEIENASITGTSNLGILAGQAIAFEEISNIVITGGTVSGTENIGGLIGYVKGGTTASKINNVGVTGVNVKGSSIKIGGLIGYLEGYSSTKVLIEKVYTTGNVTAPNYVGGLIGYTSSGTATNKQILNSYSAANVTSTTRGQGTSTANTAYAGGLIGYASNITLTNTYAIGKVTYSSTSSTPKAGGLIGYPLSVSVTNSYWDTETSGITVSGGTEEGKTTEEMLKQETYVEWNFTDIWTMNSGEYPTFK